MAELITNYREMIAAKQVEYDVSQTRYQGLYNRFIKRCMDLVLASVLLIFLLPLFLIISICILSETGFPIFYRAQRGGYHGKPFLIFKFRSMVKNADQIGGGTTAHNDSRITNIGRFLRRTKFDEIAQLINVIKGEMSFVGPRPELLQYTRQYNGDEKYILEVRPGITDYSSLALINLNEIVGDEDPDTVYEQYILATKTNTASNMPPKLL